MQLLQQLYKICQYIFDNEDEFMNKSFSDYRIWDYQYCDLVNVSFSGKKCHVVLFDLINSKELVAQVDAMDVIAWIVGE